MIAAVADLPAGGMEPRPVVRYPRDGRDGVLRPYCRRWEFRCSMAEPCACRAWSTRGPWRSSRLAARCPRRNAYGYALRESRPGTARREAEALRTIARFPQACAGRPPIEHLQHSQSVREAMKREWETASRRGA